MTLKVRPLNREIHTDDAIQLIRKNIPLKKIFEKFKKVVDFIARLYYNLSCVTDETQTTRTQQHSLRGVAQLG